MSALIDAPVSQIRKATDPATIISTPIASSSPRPPTPPSLASSSSNTSEEDEVDKNSVLNTSKLNPTPPPPVPEISETLQVPFYFSFSPLQYLFVLFRIAAVRIVFWALNLQILNMETFRQILDLDEDDHEFSLSMVEAYFSQAEETFRNLDEGWCVVIFIYLFFSLLNFLFLFFLCLAQPKICLNYLHWAIFSRDHQQLLD